MISKNRTICTFLVFVGLCSDSLSFLQHPLPHRTALSLRSSDQDGNEENKSEDAEQAERERRRQKVAEAAAKLIKRNEQADDGRSTSFLDKLNPFQAGQNLRKSLDSAISSLARARDPKQSVYYLDDRFTDFAGESTSPYLSQWDQDDYIPEILVVGATGEVGRRVVQRLLLEGRSRVRVLVPDLYTKTLNMLGTGVVYCRGDLNNMDSLETALTDVDKIVHIYSAPRPDEEEFQAKFLGFVKENLGETEGVGKIQDGKDAQVTDTEWEKLESVLEVSVPWSMLSLSLHGNLTDATPIIGTSFTSKRD